MGLKVFWLIWRRLRRRQINQKSNEDRMQIDHIETPATPVGLFCSVSVPMSNKDTTDKK
jgi:hypothetical protein